MGSDVGPAHYALYTAMNAEGLVYPDQPLSPLPWQEPPLPSLLTPAPLNRAPRHSSSPPPSRHQLAHRSTPP